MELKSAIEGRRSIRRFFGQPVPEALLRELVAAAAQAPSASNRQDWEFTAVLNPERRRQLAEAVERKWSAMLAGCVSAAVGETVGTYAANFAWFASAPVVLAISCKAPESFLVELSGGDVGTAADIAGMKASAAMAAQNLMLAAHAAGLGSCCLTGPVAAVEELRPLLRLGRRRQLVCLVALGYPQETPPPPPRKPVDEILKVL